MITLAWFAIEEVLPFTGRKSPHRTYYVNDIPYEVKMNSLRYETFKKSLDCVSCNLTGDVFLLQISRTDFFINNRPHFNLYHLGNRGGLILMTKDHVIPKSKGGSNHLGNLQTMCCICNLKKGNTINPEEV